MRSACEHPQFLEEAEDGLIDILVRHPTLIEELMDSLRLLVQQGNVLYLGASDTPAWVMSAANYCAAPHGRSVFTKADGESCLEISSEKSSDG